MSLSLAEQLMHTTVRLECDLRDGSTSTGTGFFFSFKVDEQRTIPIVVTNKHVIDGSKSGAFVITKRTDDGMPSVGSYEVIKLGDFESLWLKHPDADVDLAVFPLAPLLNHAQQSGTSLFYRSLEESIIPTQEVLDDLGGIEDVTMIGYPNGIWDARNNMPIVRRGITATHPKLDWNGLPIFVIDCACFPGSSGSPVLIFNQGGYMNARGNLSIGGSRLILLGVLYAGPQHEAEGEIQTIDVPLQRRTIALSRIPNNLGFVVKSQKINDFKPELMARS